MSKRDADIDIISIAQQARPNDIGHSDDFRAQFTALSSWAKIMPSSPELSLPWIGILPIANNYAMLRGPFQLATIQGKLSRVQKNLPEKFPALHFLMSGGGIFQRKRRINHRSEPALEDEFKRVH